MGQPPRVGHRPDPAPEVRRHPVVEPVPDPVPTGRRPVCFDPAEGYVDTPVLWRPDLAPGVRVDGPAVIEEFGSTVPLHPGFTVRMDEHLNLIVTRSAP